MVSLADDQLCRLRATLLFFSHQLVLTFFSTFCVIKIQFSVSPVTNFKSIFLLLLLLLRRFYVHPIFSNNSNCVIFYFSRFDSLIGAGTRNQEPGEKTIKPTIRRRLMLKSAHLDQSRGSLVLELDVHFRTDGGTIGEQQSFIRAKILRLPPLVPLVPLVPLTHLRLNSSFN